MDKIKKLAALKRKLEQLQNEAYEATKEPDYNQRRDRQLWAKRQPVYEEYRRLKAEVYRNGA